MWNRKMVEEGKIVRIPEKNRVHIAQKNEKEIVKMLRMTKKYGKFVDIRRTAYYDTDMEQVPQYKVPKRKQCECGTKSGW